MDIGKLDRRIELYSTTRTLNDYGEGEESYTYYRSVWAQLMTSKGTEGRADISMMSKSEIQFMLRYNSTLTTSYLVKFEGNYYNITAIDQIGRREYIKVTCVYKDNKVY